MDKVDKPKLQAFVVSYCPFGLQMQRILAPVDGLLGEVADIEVRYIGDVVDGEITAMHGEEEADENHRQICIREEQEDKFWDYLVCFLKEGDTEGCLDTAGIDKNELSDCMSDPERGVAYAQEDFTLSNQYGVTGSPTMILNGKRVSEFDFGGRTAEAVKSMICCAFKDEPDVCSQKLDETQAATGFSETYSSGGNPGSGGSC